MATVTSYTAAKLLAMDNAAIVSAAVDASGHMKLTKKDASVIDAGSVYSPSGSVIMFAGSVTPSGWLLCNGQAVSRTTYSALFAAVGTAYGTGDGSTTFNVPNLEAKFPRMQAASLGGTGGGATHTHTIAGHTHTINAHDHVLEGGTVAALAHIFMSLNTLYQERLSTQPSWNKTQSAALTFVTDTASATDGAKVSGKTATGGNNTNSGGNNSDAGSSLPPYVNLNFIIKI